MITLDFNNGKLLVPEFGGVFDLNYVTFSELGGNWVLYYNTKKVISRAPAFFQDSEGGTFASLTELNETVSNNITPDDPVSFFRLSAKSDPESNQLANVYAEYDSLSITAPATGRYIVEIDFLESYNSNRNNFMADLVVSGGISETINFLKYEPKEIGGTGINTVEATTGVNVNSGTDVRIPRRFRFVYELTAATDYVFSLQFAGQEADAEAVIYRSVISVEFKPN